jgi:hypothetical protein
MKNERISNVWNILCDFWIGILETYEGDGSSGSRVGAQNIAPDGLFTSGVFRTFTISIALKSLGSWRCGFNRSFACSSAYFTTNYEIRQDGRIYAQKNKAFFIALIAVLVIRIALRQFISGIDPISLSLLFFTVAVGYFVLWRIISFVKFRKVKQSQILGEEIVTIKA